MRSWVLNIFLVSLAFNSFAQKDSLSPDLTKEFTVIKQAELPVMNAIKLTNNPTTEDSVIPAPPIKYYTLKKQLPTEFEVEPIKPARMKGEPLNELSKAYVKGGFGNYYNTLLEGYVNNSRSRKHSVGAYAKHFASTPQGGGINGVGYNGFSHNEANLYGKKFLKKHLLSGGITYNYDAVRRYGYDPEVYADYDKNNTKQWFSKAGTDVRFMSFLKDSTKINYDANLSYYNLIDKWGLMENNGRLDVSLRRYFVPFLDSLSSKVDSSLGPQLLRLNLMVDYNNFYNGIESYGNGLFKLHPHFTARGTKWRVNLGGSMYVETYDNTANFHFYPDAHIKYNVLKDLLIPYVGVKGGIERVNYNSLTTTNPFLVTYSPMLNTKTPFDAYGGVRGAFSSKMAFNIMASRKRVVNMPLFVNRYSLGVDLDEFGNMSYYRWGGNTFTVVYDTVDVTTIDGQLSYMLGEKINVVARGEYYLYSLRTEEAAWHMPDWKATLSGSYNIGNKIITKLDVFAVSSRKALVYEETGTSIGVDELNVPMYIETLPWLIDVNLGVEYKLNTKFSAFINFNNIAGMNYYRWNKYPSQGFNVLGGLTYSFW